MKIWKRCCSIRIAGTSFCVSGLMRTGSRETCAHRPSSSKKGQNPQRVCEEFGTKPVLALQAQSTSHNPIIMMTSLPWPWPLTILLVWESEVYRVASIQNFFGISWCPQPGTKTTTLSQGGLSAGNGYSAMSKPKERKSSTKLHHVHRIIEASPRNLPVPTLTVRSKILLCRRWQLMWTFI